MAVRKSRQSLDASIGASDKELRKWAKAMINARDGLEELPGGWFCMNELAKKFDMSEAGILPHVKKLEQDGKVERKKFYVTRGKDGRRIARTHYKLK